MRRVISAWLPRWPVDRLRRARAGNGSRGGAAVPASAPFALTAPDRRGPALWSVNRAAGNAGLRRGMRLADARALCAGLVTAAADPAADRRDLERLACWCSRFSPRCAVDGRDGLLLDITGCARVFGGEETLMEEIAERLAGLGIKALLGLADTPGAARALARFRPRTDPPGTRIAEPGGSGDAIKGLPVEALGIEIGSARLLRRLGIVRIGALDRLPRAALARRFPCRKEEEGVLLRLDRAMGRRAEPMTPAVPPPVFMERLSLPEPVTDRNGIGSALARLMPGLTAALERRGMGARCLALWCCRVDGDAVRCMVSTARGTLDGSRLLRLFREKLGAVDPGSGIDCAVLHAVRVEPLETVRQPLIGDRPRSGDVDMLVERLQARLGMDAVCRLEPADCHRPEEAERMLTAGQGTAPLPWPEASDGPQRPFRLFDRPERIDATAEEPDSPPRLFSWRGALYRVVRAAGPERIEPEWQAWACAGAVRDYYDVEDAGGRRYWLYRAGFRDRAGQREASRWYIHGLYG